ncbi:MAG: ImmA/IrrE family metallo-endopeptidase [Deltaproteobacteria bacterium]|nr:ImmA/IrrE family metallo-endopeptidase [Deltaproteobacteria bacterium]
MNNYPEINLAIRVVERYKLTPPVDLLRLGRKYADIEFDHIPFDVDGVSLNLKIPGKRPRIIVNFNPPESRQRFTLAHEIGHVIIPWHFGSIIDSTDPMQVKVSDLYWYTEAEANRFASELLIPSAWAKTIIEEEVYPPKFVNRIVVTANVSPIAASIKLIQLLSKGYIFCNISETGTVIYSGRSSGTIANAPVWGTNIVPESLYSYCRQKWSFSLHGQNFWWWKLPGSMSMPADQDLRDWRSVLDSILDDLGFSGRERVKLKRRISGIVGAANSAFFVDKRSEASVYASCIQRFDGKEDLKELVDHQDFRLFLRKRVHNLFLPSVCP